MRWGESRRQQATSVQASDAGEGPALDLGALARGVWRRRLWIVSLTILGFLTAFAFVSMVKPRYTGEAKVLIERNDSYFTRPLRETALDPAPTIDAEAVESQVQLVTSRDLARRAAAALKLAGNPEFDALATGLSPLNRLFVILGMQRDPHELSPEDRVLDAYYDRLLVYPDRKSVV